MLEFLTYARYAVFGVFAIAALAATGSWLVRARYVSPFKPLGRFLRSSTDPIIKPVETRVIRMGGNPVNAGWWLIVGVAIAGILLLSLLTWAFTAGQQAYWAFRAGPRAVIAQTVRAVFGLLMLAVFVRVIASWFGLFEHNRWIRWTYFLTDWLVKPIRRLLPPFGMFDLSPLVALLALWLMKGAILMVLGP
jgi:YggT family protein